MRFAPWLTGQLLQGAASRAKSLAPELLIAAVAAAAGSLDPDPVAGLETVGRLGLDRLAVERVAAAAPSSPPARPSRVAAALGDQAHLHRRRASISRLFRRRPVAPSPPSLFAATARAHAVVFGLERLYRCVQRIRHRDVDRARPSASEQAPWPPTEGLIVGETVAASVRLFIVLPLAGESASGPALEHEVGDAAGGLDVASGDRRAGVAFSSSLSARGPRPDQQPAEGGLGSKST